MDDKAADSAAPTPVPRPRRQNTAASHLPKSAYENVSIDLINKTVTINDENLQENANNVKLQTDKLFLTPATITGGGDKSALVAKELVATSRMNDLASTASSKLQKSNVPIGLREVNALNDLNVVDAAADAAQPTPAPRRANITKIQNLDQSPLTSTPLATKLKTTNETRSRKFLDLKPKFRSRRKKQSGSYSFGGGGGGGAEGASGNERDDGEPSAGKKASFSLRRAGSDSSVSSIDSNVSRSTDNSSVASESKRHATASPG